MPITLDGTGSITGLNTTGISAVQTVTSVPSSALPVGSVIQTVSATYSTRQSFATSGGNVYYDTGLTASITPRSSSNKILVLVTATHQSSYNSTGNVGSSLGLKRNSTRIAGFVGNHVATITNGENLAPTGNLIMLDSPASASSVTYTVQIASVGATQTVWFNGTYSASGFDAFITLMEIAA